MRCPFLRNALVKYCEASAYRKMIVDAARDAGHERCSSPSWPSCMAAASQSSGSIGLESCPFLHEARVEFCGGAPVPRYIPASDALLSHCNSDAHHFCEVWLAHADPTGERLLPLPGHEHHAIQGDGTALVDGIPVPLHLAYAANHMWLDVAGDGCCHVGIDAFLARIIGSVDKISFVATRAFDRPVAVLTVNGVDLQMVFPSPLHLATANVYLRTSLGKLTSDPYGAGWLFESMLPAHAAADPRDVGLVTGDVAAAWMQVESDRLTGYVHETLSHAGPDGTRLMADGGIAAANLAQQLGREDLLNLFSEFFSLHAGGRSS